MADLTEEAKSEPMFALNVNSKMAKILLELTTQAAAKGPDAHALGDLHDGALAASAFFKGAQNGS
jgi:hypothetical protein